MLFWVYMLFCVLLIPLVMIGFGKRFSKAPPETIQGLFGYRSSMSMKNQDTWTFAHAFCGRLWHRMGWVLLPLSVLPMLFLLGEDADALGIAGSVICAVQLAPMLLSILLTERALRRTFDKNGVRR